MANLDGLTAAELKEYLSGHICKLQTLKTILIVVIVVVVVAVVGHIIYYYNYLTTLQYDVLAAKGKVESAVQYRANLAPVLIESVVSFVEHEDNVFNRAVDARERSLGAARQTADKLDNLKISPNQPIDEVFQKIMAIAEQYPDLKTSEPFQLLMQQVGDVEAEIFKQRVEYNNIVNLYTTAISIFPGNFYAATLFDFPSFSYFKGNHRSEWPHFKGKSHSEWPQVSLETDRVKDDKNR